MSLRENLPDGVTWQNWQAGPANRWAYQHIDDIVATTPVPRGDGPVLELPAGPPIEPPGLDAYLEETCTDGLIVLHGRDVVLERYLNGMTPGTRHLLQSVTKSMCSAVFSQYVESGAIDLEQPASAYVPVLKGSAYGEATLRQTLDMTVAVAYDETYDDPESEVSQHDRASGWSAPREDSPSDVTRFLATLRGNGVHGQKFQYCSANTDVLGQVLESVTGRRLDQLLSTDLWSRIGAEYDAFVTVDGSGFPLASGGMCVSLRDLARFGRVVLDGGVGPTGEQVVPRSWIDDVRNGGDPDVDYSELTDFLPNGGYRSQFWVSGDEHGCFFGVGIHGQYVWMNPQTDVVIARLATAHLADDDDDFRRNLAFLDRLSTLPG